MRIIAGEFRGRKLTAARGNEMRPTLDRVKESLFSMLGEEVVGAQVLDLFCGSGALGLEALSRGAERAVLVDVGRHARLAVRKNVETLGVRDRVQFLGLDVRRALRKLAAEEEKPHFDLIFADPPYFQGFAKPVFDALAELDLLAPDGMVIFEHHKKETPQDEVKEWEVVRQRRTGDTTMTFFRLPMAE